MLGILQTPTNPLICSLFRFTSGLWITDHYLPQELLHHPFLACINLEEAFYSPNDDEKAKFARISKAGPAPVAVGEQPPNYRGAGPDMKDFADPRRQKNRSRPRGKEAHVEWCDQNPVATNYGENLLAEGLDDNGFQEDGQAHYMVPYVARGGAVRRPSSDASSGGKGGRQKQKSSRNARERLKKRVPLERMPEQMMGGSADNENEANKRKRNFIKIHDLKGDLFKSSIDS